MKTTVTLSNGYEMPILGLGYVLFTRHQYKNLLVST